jgi:hypothetical protein
VQQATISTEPDPVRILIISGSAQRMNENTKISGAMKLIFTSPYSLLLFIVIPIYTVLSLRLNLHVSGTLLLVNNGCFLAFVAMRLVWYVLRMRRDIRYGADCRRPESVITLDRPLSELKKALAGAGYSFDASGHYGEKRDTGYLGTAVLYGGMLLLLLVGSYDYLKEYSIMVRIGVGEPMSLDGKGLTGAFEAGEMAGTENLPLLQVRKQILPNPQWPQGASEIVLLSKDRKELAKGTIAPGKPFRYGSLDYHMSKFVFDAVIVIRAGQAVMYDNFVKLLPLQQKKDVYSYVGSLKNIKFPDVSGIVWLNPEKKMVRIEAKKGEKPMVDVVLELWGKNKITQGEYLASLEGIAHWTEIRVARGRHRGMLMIGAILFICGGIMRLVLRPQRVWLEEAEEGSRVRAIGGKTKKLLNAER